MEENKHLNVEMGPEASKECLQNPNMGSSESETLNGIPVEEYMLDRYSCMSRYLMLMSLDESLLYSRLPFLQELEHIEFFGVYDVANFLRLYLFREEFNSILERRTEVHFNNEMKHAEFLLSRCVLLCLEPTYPRFVLVVAFLMHVVILDVNKVQCFRLTYIAEFCLNVLHGRMFKKIFRSPEDYQRLQIFCQEFCRKLTLFSTMSELRKTPFFVTWRKLILGCIVDPHVFFPFEEEEIDFFYYARRVMNNLECKPDLEIELDITYFSGRGLRKMQSGVSFVVLNAIIT
ncbi:hypothetical protein TNIN_401831 [Trichonephila inaurata madagascariensis]|uniref:Uncharacterized protein n=1 Tax=Trichonephila inaurata madagascariensis TaxID=2747483 RepID=A0A8X6I9G7_9ARAC|nr:hypothetical protein TNIN_401831 [Trichonephila inaurata madagascariensis]